MKSSSCAAAAFAMLLLSAPLIAGESGMRRAPNRHSPAPHLRGMSSGCNSCFSDEIHYESFGDSGCHAGCESRCDTHWGILGTGCGTADCSCDACKAPLLPSLISGLDCLVQRLYYDPCNMPCPRPRCGPRNCMDIWFGYNAGCGCSSFEPEMENWPSTPPTKSPRIPAPIPSPAPTDPFKDDELQSPPSVPADLGVKRTSPKLQPVKHRRPKYSAEPLVVAPVKIAEVVEMPRKPEPVTVKKVADAPAAAEPMTDPAPQPTRAVSKVKQVRHEAPSKVIPKNPLRDE
jgi:hypothetical protein